MYFGQHCNTKEEATSAEITRLEALLNEVEYRFIRLRDNASHITDRRLKDLTHTMTVVTTRYEELLLQRLAKQQQHNKKL